MSRELTKDEVRDMFIAQVELVCHHWLKNSRVVSDREKVEGAVFSIMNILDGTSGGFPAAIDLVLRPHPDDKNDCIENDEDWIEDGMVINDECHLHELVFKDISGGQ